MKLKNPFLIGGQWSKNAYRYFYLSLLQLAAQAIFQLFIYSKLRTSPADQTIDRFPLTIIANSTHLQFTTWALLSGNAYSLVSVYIFALLKSELVGFCSYFLDIFLLVAIAIEVAGIRHHFPLDLFVGVSVSVILVQVGIVAAKAVILYSKLRLEYGWLAYRALGANYLMRRSYFNQRLLLGVSIVTSFFSLALAVYSSVQRSWIGPLLLLVAFYVLISTTNFAVYQELQWLLSCCTAFVAGTTALLIYFLVDSYGQKASFFVKLYSIVLIFLASLITCLAIACRFTITVGLRQQLNNIHILKRDLVDLEEIYSIHNTSNGSEAADGQFIKGLDLGPNGNGYANASNTEKKSALEKNVESNYVSTLAQYRSIFQNTFSLPSMTKIESNLSIPKTIYSRDVQSPPPSQSRLPSAYPSHLRNGASSPVSVVTTKLPIFRTPIPARSPSNSFSSIASSHYHLNSQNTSWLHKHTESINSSEFSDSVPDRSPSATATPQKHISPVLKPRVKSLTRLDLKTALQHKDHTINRSINQNLYLGQTISSGFNNSESNSSNSFIINGFGTTKTKTKLVLTDSELLEINGDLFPITK